MPKSKNEEKKLMGVTIRIGGGYIFVHQGNQYGKNGEYRTGFGMVGIVGGVRLTQTRTFKGNHKGPVAERIVPVGIISVHVQCPMHNEEEGEAYEYMGPSQYVAKNWPITEHPKWRSEIRGLNEQELQKYYQAQGQEFVPPPLLFSGFSVLAFFNHGTFSADKQRILTGSNMTTGEVIVKPGARVDFKLPVDETLIVWLATPRSDGGEIVMRQEAWLALKGEGVVTAVEIGIEPLDPYASLPVLGYEGLQKPPPESL
jgi:hypothetical protein